MPTDFLIVGGGIGGLVAAELLGRGGRRVVVLERSTGPPAWTRPEVLWPATMELLASLLPGETAARREPRPPRFAVPLAGIEVFDGMAWRWGLAPETLERAGVQPWSTDPNQTRELLMRLTSFELVRGVEVVEILKEGERIVGARGKDVASGQVREWLGEWVVGDDGANSLVRRACGLELAARFLPLDLMAFGCEWPGEFRYSVHLWPHPRGLASGMLAVGMLPVPSTPSPPAPLPQWERGDREADASRSPGTPRRAFPTALKAVGLVPMRPRLLDGAQAQATWREMVTSEPGLEGLLGSRRFPEDFQRVRRPWGHAARYGAKGALLMGDAAHPVSPAGGQGANMSVADGRAIAELALAGERNLLAAYERVRRPANTRSMRFTRGATFAFGLPEWVLASRAVLWLGGQVISRPWFQVRGLRIVSRAFVAR